MALQRAPANRKRQLLVEARFHISSPRLSVGSREGFSVGSHDQAVFLSQTSLLVAEI